MWHVAAFNPYFFLAQIINQSHNQEQDIFAKFWKFASSSKIVRAKDGNGFPSLSLTLDDNDLPSTFLVPHKDWPQVIDESRPALHPLTESLTWVGGGGESGYCLPFSPSRSPPPPSLLPPSSQCSTSCRAATMVLESRCCLKQPPRSFCRSRFKALWSDLVRSCLLYWLWLWALLNRPIGNRQFEWWMLFHPKNK